MRLRPLKPLQNRLFSALPLDSTLLGVIILMCVWGAVMIYSASLFVAVRFQVPPYHYFVLQIYWLIIGFTGMFIFSRINYKWIPKLAAPGLLVCIVALILVLIIGRGNGSKRWIEIFDFSFQASELTKLVFLCYLSGWLGKQKDISKKESRQAIKAHFKNELLPFLGVLSIICILILAEPDLDTTIMLGLTSFIVYYVSGNDRIHLLGSIVTGATFGLLGLGATFFAQYRLKRIVIYIHHLMTGEILDPLGDGFQLRQILVAVASGGIFGLGFGESRQKVYFLGNTAFTDTIFAIMVEELGLIAGILVICLFVYIVFKGYKIAINAPDKTAMLLALSMATWMGLQAFFHIGANVALVPINGNTLPFFSYGGSSTVVDLCAMGIILNISRYHRESTKSK